jgi:UDP-3-O-[3-hydroxymyristoyl] glucosamine N-acyltransferase
LTTIGRHVIVTTPASLAHDIVIGDFVTIHPSAAISGHVVIEGDVVIGVGAAIVNGAAAKPLRVGRGGTSTPAP